MEEDYSSYTCETCKYLHETASDEHCSRCIELAQQKIANEKANNSNNRQHQP